VPSFCLTLIVVSCLGLLTGTRIELEIFVSCSDGTSLNFYSNSVGDPPNPILFLRKPDCLIGFTGSGGASVCIILAPLLASSVFDCVEIP
jgi:hypothetical protein